ncbi:hypothetical protein HY772_04020 [Candidatus Woesearchaeota archaeon]|nr:hypothetical protein [Candidatus Woesearchaeota archaeon]
MIPKKNATDPLPKADNPNASSVKRLKLPTKSLLISRLPRQGNNEYKSVSIKLFNVNDPHKTLEEPVQTLEFHNIEKVRIRRMNVSYYTEGNDLIVNHLEEVYFMYNGTTLIVRGYQGLNSPQ